MREIIAGWVVLDRNGKAKRYAYGYGMRELVHLTKKEAIQQARLLAEREEELTCGDFNRWEWGRMPLAKVRKMGYRIVRARVLVN